MKKGVQEPAQDPEELAAEERVRQLMDIEVPEPTPPVAAKSITILHDDEPAPAKTVEVEPAPQELETKEAPPEAELPSAPEVDVPKPKKSKKIAIAHHDDEPVTKSTDEEPSEATEPSSEPEASELDEAIAAANEQLAETRQKPIKVAEAETTAPVLPTRSRKKIVPISEQVEEASEENKEVQETDQEQTTVTEEQTDTTPQLPAAEPSVRPLGQARDIFTPEPLPDEQELPEIPPIYEDVETSQAVEDILRTDSDKLLDLSAEPDTEPEAAEAVEEARPKKKKHHWLKYSAVRWIIALLLIAGLGSTAAVPTSRYFALNHVGVRSSMSLQVIDQSTDQPLKGVTVTVGGQKVQSDASGQVNLHKIPLGPTQIKIEKRAFAPVTLTQIIGWGSNPLGDVKLTPTGTQYGFKIIDYVSEQAIKGAEASAGEASALSDDKGIIKLTIDKPSEAKFPVTIKLNSYRDEVVTVDPDSKEDQTVKLVLSRQQAFVTRRDGRYDVYKVDIDGTHEKRLLAGTGSERDDMVLVPHPSEEYAAFVSTRDNKRNAEGYLLSSLTILNLSEESSKVVASSERLQLVDWIGSRLIFVQIAAGESAESPKRHRLMAFDLKTSEVKEYASSNFFNDVVILDGKIYYAPSSAYQPASEAGLFRVDADGNNRSKIIDKEVWNIFRTGYSKLQLSTPQDWYEYTAGGQPVKLGSAPVDPTAKVFIDSPSGKFSLWTEKRDGKGTLLFYDVASKKDSVVRTQSGLTYPLRWLNDTTVVFRVNNETETADYVLTLGSDQAKKVADVTNTGGIDRWFFY